MAEDLVFPLEVRGLGVRLGNHDALRGVELDLDGRARVVVLGANGAGKSVLLRALHGLLPPTSGSIRWAGSASRPKRQAMVFQRPVLLRRPTLANIAYALAVNGIAEPERSKRALGALEHVGLSHLAARQARVLSGGEQQRIALARAWALEPRVLFLDEPTASLDPAAAGDIERIARDIHAAGAAIVMTTHNLGLARRFADEIVFLHQGRLTERTRTDCFFAAPSSREAAAFLEGELP
jgi:tungstate transport system ATP-binding protein